MPQQRLNPRWQRWSRERLKTKRLIRKFEAYESMHGRAWVDSMIKHYKSVLADLDAHEPPRFYQVPTWAKD